MGKPPSVTMEFGIDAHAQIQSYRSNDTAHHNRKPGIRLADCLGLSRPACLKLCMDCLPTLIVQQGFTTQHFAIHDILDVSCAPVHKQEGHGEVVIKILNKQQLLVVPGVKEPELFVQTLRTLLKNPMQQPGQHLTCSNIKPAADTLNPATRNGNITMPHSIAGQKHHWLLAVLHGRTQCKRNRTQHKRLSSSRRSSNSSSVGGASPSTWQRQCSDVIGKKGTISVPDYVAEPGAGAHDIEQMQGPLQQALRRKTEGSASTTASNRNEHIPVTYSAGCEQATVPPATGSEQLAPDAGDAALQKTQAITLSDKWQIVPLPSHDVGGGQQCPSPTTATVPNRNDDNTSAMNGCLKQGIASHCLSRTDVVFHTSHLPSNIIEKPLKLSYLSSRPSQVLESVSGPATKTCQLATAVPDRLTATLPYLCSTSSLPVSDGWKSNDQNTQKLAQLLGDICLGRQKACTTLTINTTAVTCATGISKSSHGSQTTNAVSENHNCVLDQCTQTVGREVGIAAGVCCKEDAAVQTSFPPHSNCQDSGVQVALELAHSGHYRQHEASGHATCDSCAPIGSDSMLLHSNGQDSNGIQKLEDPSTAAASSTQANHIGCVVSNASDTRAIDSRHRSRMI